MAIPPETSAPTSNNWMDPSVAGAICSLGMRPQILMGFFVEYLRKHFSQPVSIEEPDLRRLIFQMGDNTGILIESIFHWTPEKTEKRAGIVVKPNSFDTMRMGIDDRHQGITMNASGNPTYETFWVGSFTIFTLSETGAQAMLLGTEVARELSSIGPQIRDNLNLTRFQVKQFGAPAELEEASENWVIPITVAIAYNQSWQIRAVAPLLQGVSIQSLVDCPSMGPVYLDPSR